MRKGKKYVSTTDPCKLCAPLGASLVFKGVRNAIPLLHGSQGCATYIRRYFIGHFREPIDIASSNFSEETTVFGGKENFEKAVFNISAQYNPEVIGVATTCLSETIGDDIRMYMKELLKDNRTGLPHLVQVSTPSYKGTHMEGYYGAVKALVSQLSEDSVKTGKIIVLPGMVSPADLRYIKYILSVMELDYTIIPDYSESMDDGPWDGYQKLSSKGTSVEDIMEAGGGGMILEVGSPMGDYESAGEFLASRFGIERYSLPLPIGISNADKFFDVLISVKGGDVPEEFLRERGRLIDAYSDSHKCVFGKKAAIYGEEELVSAISSFLAEIGIIPVLCATGSENGSLNRAMERISKEYGYDIRVREGVDFCEIGEDIEELGPDMLIGNSKGYKISSKYDIPLVRIGFPIHDRIGGQRLLHIGYKGTQELFDRIVNTLLERKQVLSSVGYSYF